MTQPNAEVSERMLTPRQVAAMFAVNAKTVSQWARAGKLSARKTLGGHRRYFEAEVRALLKEQAEPMSAVALSPVSG